MHGFDWWEYSRSNRLHIEVQGRTADRKEFDALVSIMSGQSVEEWKRQMQERKEFTGQLIGGPDDGNFITASVPEFRCLERITHWLDGPDKAPFIEDISGRYIWSPDKLCFRWLREETWHN